MPEMKKYNFAIFCMCLALFGLFYLLKDSVAPQNQDFLKGVLSASIGGLIGAIGNFIVSLLNNDKAEQRQRVDFELQMKKLRYEQRKELCADFLSAINPHLLGIGKFDVTRCVHFYTLICLECPHGFAMWAKNMQDILLKDSTIQESLGKSIKVDSDEFNELMKKLAAFLNFYNIFIKITQKMLNEEEILPPGEWNLDDFEGSIPLDYRKLIF